MYLKGGTIKQFCLPRAGRQLFFTRRHFTADKQDTQTTDEQLLDKCDSTKSASSTVVEANICHVI